MFKLISLGDMSAGEGFGGVISSALLIAGTLALIYGVLVLLDRYHKKHSSEDDGHEKHEDPVSQPKSFPQVLNEQIKKQEDKENRL